MNRSLFFKLGAIGFLTLLLVICLARIDSLIDERQSLREEVVRDIARSSSYSQQFIGPLVVVPYRKKIREWQENTQTKQRFMEEREVSGQLYFPPDEFSLDGKIKIEQRARGIYQARLFHADSKIGGRFELPARLGVGADFADYSFGTPSLAVGINDIRGIEKISALRLNEQDIEFEPGTTTTLLGAGIHAELPALDAAQSNRLEFSFDLRLQGTNQFDISPVGRNSQVSLASDWPHPSFVGEYLPVERSVGGQGFNARWQTSFFSTNLQEILANCAYRSSCDEFKARRFGVSFIDPVDQYLKTDRAIKYALLFIALTFAVFFLFEVLKGIAVHPIQYGLVGAALALFYLLLLSLSEHIGFAAAYLLSSIACVALIGFYIGHVLGSFLRGIGFTAGLAALYALLYCLLSAEDYALLMGSLLLFCLLAAVMVLTRRVNWSALRS